MCRQNKDEDQRLYLSKSIIIIKIDNKFFIIDFFVYLCFMIENDTSIKLKTKAEIIEETAAFYNLNNRSVHITDGCVYFNYENGNKCAVGRCLNADVVGLGSMNKETSAEELFEELGFDILKDEYKIKDISFWQQLQFLHDTEKFWSVNGLTEKGLEYKKQLLQKYDN